jgi:hypothetical protein
MEISVSGSLGATLFIASAVFASDLNDVVGTDPSPPPRAHTFP